MANDRLFLHCPRCGHQTMIAKRMGDHWYTGHSFSEERLNEFFKAHFGCELNGDAYAFELYDEHGPMAVAVKDYQSVP